MDVSPLRCFASERFTPGRFAPRTFRRCLNVSPLRCFAFWVVALKVVSPCLDVSLPWTVCLYAMFVVHTCSASDLGTVQGRKVQLPVRQTDIVNRQLV